MSARRAVPEVIAIDGPSAAGKGTLAKRLANHFGLACLDTGLLYRAVGTKVIRAGGDPTDGTAAVAAAKSLRYHDLEDPELRSDEAAEAASLVAAIPEVRRALVDFQRHFATHPPGGAAGAVIDGRDIGTVVYPGADCKLFVTANVEVRAKRRLKELRERGITRIYTRVLKDLKDRDARDSQRDVAPLRKAEDAFLIDTTELDADEVFAAALKLVDSRNRAGDV
ncbi:MAG: (d)CMP kinase [Alphaproteobacteria bacterium]